MQLDYLRSFLEVYRTGSMTSAARNLNITQPAVSMHIKTLETGFEKPLFQRVGRNLVSTPLADELANLISSSIDNLENSLGYFKSRSNNIEGTVYIAGHGEFTQFAATKVMAGLLPLNIKLRIITGDKDIVIDALESGDADFVFLNTPYKPDIYEHDILKEEVLIPVASPDWVSKNFDTCRNLNNLINMPIIAYDEDLTFENNYYMGTLGKKYEQSPAVIIKDMRIILEFLYQGYGYAILPRYLCEDGLVKKKIIQFIHNNKSPTYRMHLIAPKNKRRDHKVYFVKNYIKRAFEQKINI